MGGWRYNFLFLVERKQRDVGGDVGYIDHLERTRICQIYCPIKM